MSLVAHVKSPIVWTIAGSDSCAGAGIQADLKTFTALGAHGCTVIASLTAQNSGGVSKVESVSPAMLKAQIDALRNDMPPQAIKLGLLGDAEGIKIIAQALASLDSYVVGDPVLVSSSGTSLLAPDAIAAMKQDLFPHIDLLTPNLAEAEFLTGTKLKNEEDVERAAETLRALGVKAVIIKGLTADDHVQDFYSNGTEKFWLTLPYLEGPGARGTGCTFASALAAAHAFGFNDADSAVIAKAYVHQALRMAQPIGKGLPILSHEAWPAAEMDFPWLTPTAKEGRARPGFPDCGTTALGFYPVVDSLAWLERLRPLGVTTAQLRIKDKTGDALEDEIIRTIAYAHEHRCRLFINDYWQLAIKHRAYGVHLGQEDLQTADFDAIAQAGLRLGISTHCYAEVARAHALRPSYIAIGPIFPTMLKSMKFAPQGIDALRNWRRMLGYPLVAIGGITLETAPEITKAGADSIAVVSDVTRNTNPESRATAWLDYFSNSSK